MLLFLRLVLMVTVLTLAAPAWAGVRIDGLEEPLLGNALAHLALDDENCSTPEWRVRRLLREGRGEIEEALRAYGHYGATIRARLEDSRDDCWQAVYEVTPGEPVIVRELSVSLTGAATQDPPFRRIIAASPLQRGQPLRHDHYENLKQALMETASRRGYADARLLRHEILVHPKQLAADIVLEIDSGQRYAFGDTRFEQDVLESDLVEGYLPYRRGQPFDSNLLAELYSALAGSDYFERIQVESLTAQRADGQIPVRVRLSPGKRRLYTAGIGYSTNTGARLRSGYNDRRLDRRGRQFGVNLLMSPVITELSANYRRPRGDPKTDWISLDGGFKHENTDSSRSDAYQLGIRRIKERPGNWRENRFLELLVEEFTISDQRDRTTLVIPGISWSRTKSENRLRPRRGSRLFLEVRGSADALGSSTTFLRLDTQGKWIRGFGKTRLIVRAEAGLSATADFNELPPSLRFFAGGDSSIRGYAFEELGPRDADNEVIGGTGRLVASAEIEYDIKPKWSIAMFVDSGNAFDDFDLEPQTGAGLGARWHSPVGPVRFDLARPFNGDDRSVRIHISFGPDL